MEFDRLIAKLKEKEVEFECGLNEDEFSIIEKMYDIKFPPDLRTFLSSGLPISNHFINWRDVSESNVEKIKTVIEWPLRGMIFDIEHNAFWYDAWGEKPTSIEDAIQKCKEEYAKVPKMIPICSHRYIPSEPLEENNPIFSIYQTDIIYYGENITKYLEIEFRMKKYQEIDFDVIKEIRFWSDIVG